MICGPKVWRALGHEPRVAIGWNGVEIDGGWMVTSPMSLVTSKALVIRVPE
jgi:hypothetical protein